MFGLYVNDIFKITGRGYVLTGTVQDPKGIIKIGDYLKALNNEVLVKVKGVEMLNYGSKYKERINESIGLLVDITEDEAKELIGKTLYKYDN
ncbi:hypothetical protein [Gorillibacterium sp. sgz5001074]|uniref:hypothetical protein n=1 Tax=Gorillibacterium sp. sgz5001074 TaxID=3446695 RepID=UPI003F668A23